MSESSAESTPDTKPQKLGQLPYVIGGISFIPLLGVPFGMIAIAMGLANMKRGGKLLAAIGAAGIAFTVILYGALFYFGFVQRGGIYDDMRTGLARTSLNSLVQSIEFYKVQHGEYPASLKVLRESLPKDSLVITFDPSDITLGEQTRYFYYERVGDDHYYLRGVGADGLAFTADDILPQISAAPNSRVGLLVERAPDANVPARQPQDLKTP